MSRLVAALRLLFADPGLFTRKVRNEFMVPSNGFTALLRRIYCGLLPRSSGASGGNRDRFLFVYDTTASPVTFDFLHYLYFANWRRLVAGKSHLDVLLVTRPDLASSREQSYVQAVGSDNLVWRITNLLIPLSRLFPAVGRVQVVEQAQAFAIAAGYEHMHPAGYAYATPKSAVTRLDVDGLRFLPELTVTETARKIVDAYFPPADARRLVTITLRSYDYVAVRNSDIPSWLAFARALDPRAYQVVFVPDASMHGVATMPQIQGFDIFDPACWNIELRAALYGRAWMNIGVACGPLAISALMPHVVTVMIDRSQDYPADYLNGIRATTGVLPGERPAFYSAACHFYLGRDDTPTILKIFDAHAR